MAVKMAGEAWDEIGIKMAVGVFPDVSACRGARVIVKVTLSL